jgi:hypothetical protein
MRTVVDQAYPHNNTILDDPSSAFGQLDTVDHKLTSSQLQEFKDTLQDSQTISAQSLRNNATGPAAKVGSFVGQYAPVAADLAGGGGAAGAVAALVGGHAVGGKLGAAAGRSVDRMLGTDVPPIVLQGIAARRALARMGISPQDRATGVAPPAPAPEPVGPYGVTGKNPTPMAPPRPVAPVPEPTVSPYGPTNKNPTPMAPPRPAAPGPTPGPYGSDGSGPTPMAPPRPAAPVSEPTVSPYGPTGKNPPPRPPPRPDAPDDDETDPDTGNAPDTIPVNTPIKSGKAGRLAAAQAA